MPWHKNSRISTSTDEEIREINVGGRTFYIKKCGKTCTPHRSFSDAMWGRVYKSIYDVFTKKEIERLFSDSKLVCYKSNS